MDFKHFYLIHFQYLGYRYHGWAKQPNLKTVHHMIDKTLRYVLGKERIFRTLGSSRTDAMVSANHSVFELFTMEAYELDWLKENINKNLPSDIKILQIEEVDHTFNVIQAPRIKEYQYLFSFGEKPHPFCASIMAYFPSELDIELMKKGAEAFIGEHNFRKFCTKPTEMTKFQRSVTTSEIVINETYQANFFPKVSFLYKVHGKGFMRHQIRLMMGQLDLLGQHKITLAELKEMLVNPDNEPLKAIAPPSGLILNKVNFDNDKPE